MLVVCILKDYVICTTSFSNHIWPWLWRVDRPSLLNLMAFSSSDKYLMRASSHFEIHRSWAWMTKNLAPSWICDFRKNWLRKSKENSDAINTVNEVKFWFYVSISCSEGFIWLYILNSISIKVLGGSETDSGKTFCYLAPAVYCDHMAGVRSDFKLSVEYLR